MRRSLLPIVALAGLLWASTSLAAVGDGAAAEQILTAVVADAAASSAAREVQAARAALDRARAARGGGDALHADQLEAVARVWAESARDLLATVKVEQEAIAAQKKAAETRELLERERTLLEETISRRGRAKVALERAEAEAAERKAAPPPGEKGNKAPAKQSNGKKAKK